ncbi:MAG TPA: zf-TFIIB domain-containing protein [Alphaproteobacteria bacterium]|nr:zf-TFIIB domain-containing protein [Alphaproteobacteria bacterium]
MPVQPSDQEEEAFARLKFERRRKELADQESLAAEAERQRALEAAHNLCPKCGAPLVALHCRGVQLDQCWRCQGIWLDYGELDQVLAEEPQQGFFGALKRIFG